MEVKMFVLFPVIVLLAMLFIAIISIVMSPRRRLFGAGLLMATVMLLALGGIAMSWLSVRSIRRVDAYRRPNPQLQSIRLATEAIAQRHAAEMRHVDQDIRLASDPSAPPTEPPAPFPTAAPVVDSMTQVVEPAPGEVAETDSAQAAAVAVGEIASEEELQTLSEVGDRPTSVEDPVPSLAADLGGNGRRDAENAQTVVGNAAGARAADVERPVAVGHVVPLSVAPDSTPLQADIPTWVRQPPDQIDGHLALVLVSDPYEDRFACDEDLERRTRGVIEQAARQRCRQHGLPMTLPINLTYGEIGMVSRQRYYQPRLTSVGEMLQGYQLTVLDDAFELKLDRRIADAVVDRRLATTGMLSGSVLGIVSVLFGVFRWAARTTPDPLSA